MEKYNCCVFRKEGNCGPDRKTKKDELYNLGTLLASVNTFLGFKNCERDINEKELIESQSGFRFSDNDIICGNHRNIWGKSYKHANKCYHPFHKGNNVFQATSLQKSSFDLWKKINRNCANFPLRGLLCKACRTNPLASEMDVEFDSSEDHDGDDFAVPYDYYKVKLNSSLHSVGLSSIKFQSQQVWKDCSNSTQKYVRHAFKQYIDIQKNLFAKGFMPNDVNGFLDAMEEKEDLEERDMSLDQLGRLYTMASSAQGKFAVLTIASKVFSRDTLTKELGCSKRQIDLARAIVTEKGICEPKDKLDVTRNRMDPALIRHFLQHLFETNALMTSAYGTNMQIYTDGSRVVAPKPVLTGVRHQICSSYISLCKNTGSKCLGMTSLNKILDNVNPASRCQVAGLDNFLVDGETAMEDLIGIAYKIDPVGAEFMQKKLRKCETYIKTLYTLRCGAETESLSHCTLCTLSEEKEHLLMKRCNIEHSKRCTDCDMIIDCLRLLEQMLESYVGEDKYPMKFDLEVSKDRIINWLSHQIRGYQQNLAKINAFGQVSEGTAFWIRDWSQKILPMRFHEGQAEYFGRKGFSAHVDVFFFKKNDTLMKYVLITLLESSDQGLIDTLAVAEVVLAQLRKDLPEVQEIYGRSDNASCYSANGSFEALYNLAADIGLRLRRWDFSEPQKGKDQADRESACFKAFLRAYISSGKNAITVQDLKKGILFNGGPKNTKVAIISTTPSAKLNNVKVIKNISNIHSVEFHESHYMLWKYYNIGEGLKNVYSGTRLQSTTQVLSGFNETTRSGEITKAKKRNTVMFPYYCNEYTCDGVFETEETLMEHILSGKHSAFNPTTSTDEIKLVYRQIATADFEKFRPSPLAIASTNQSSLESRSFFKIGWGLPVRKSGRLDKETKAFCFEKFLEGARSGRKLSPELICQLIKETIDPNTNKKMFTFDQYLTPRQVKSLLSRFSQQCGSKIQKLEVEKFSELMNIDDDVALIEEINEDVCKAIQEHEESHNVELIEPASKKCKDQRIDTRFDKYLSVDSSGISGTKLGSSSSSTSKKKDGRRSRSKSRDRSQDKHESRKSSSNKHKRKRSRERRSKSRDKRSKSGEKDKNVDDKSRDKDRERDVKKKDDKDKRDREKQQKTVDSKEEYKTLVVNLIDKILEAQSTIDRVLRAEDTKKEGIKSVSKIAQPIAESTVEQKHKVPPSSECDQEPSSTVTIPTPPEYLFNKQLIDVETILWSGTITMIDIATFQISIHAVNGDCDSIRNELPTELDVVGRIIPDTVWEYIEKIKKTKEILIIRLSAATEDDNDAYYELYKYLYSKKRLGVIKTTSRSLKDFYIFPLAAHKSLPSVLQSIDGQGFENGRPDLLLGIIVKTTVALQKRVISTQIAPITNKVSRMTDTSLLKPRVANIIEEERYTPPSSPKTKSHGLKKTIDEVLEDGDEPYSPGGSDDEIPFQTSINISTPAAIQPSALYAQMEQDEIQRKMDELNRQIEAQKMEIAGMLHSDTDEPYSPTSSLSTSTKSAAIPALANISIPSNLQEILNSIKQVSSAQTADQSIHAKSTVVATLIIHDDDEYTPTSVDSEYNLSADYVPTKTSSLKNFQSSLSIDGMQSTSKEPSKLAQLTEEELLSMVPDDIELPPVASFKKQSNEPSTTKMSKYEICEEEEYVP